MTMCARWRKGTAQELTRPKSGGTFGMYYSPDGTSKLLKFAVAISFTAVVFVSPLAFAHEDHEKEKLDAASEKTLTGEIVDLMCYADHNASGEKHAKCAATCIKGGGPVAILSEGKTYIVVGDHKPMNDQLAEFAGKTITLKGKLASNGGIPLLENAEIVKK
ncbi:MAG: hypothetical protein QOF24_2854 [Verrucomicrobiota bacterium]|jgi:hypothetical protein